MAKLKENQILVIIKEPGREARLEPLFDNTLEAFQEAVGGYIEVVTFAQGCCLICNEEGRLHHLPYNVTFLGHDFVGTVLVVGVKGDEFCSLKASWIPTLMKSFNKEQNDNGTIAGYSNRHKPENEKVEE